MVLRLASGFEFEVMSVGLCDGLDLNVEVRKVPIELIF